MFFFGNGRESMDEDEIRQLWAEGQDWVIKRNNRQFFYRPHGKPGEWQPGLPPGTLQWEIEILFHL